MWLPFLHDYSRLLSLLRRRRPCHHLLTTRHTITSSTGITITHDMMTHCIILCTSQAPPTAAAPPVAPPSPPPSPSGIISMLSDCYVYIQKRLLFSPAISIAWVALLKKITQVILLHVTISKVDFENKFIIGTEYCREQGWSSGSSIRFLMSSRLWDTLIPWLHASRHSCSGSCVWLPWHGVTDTVYSW